MLTKRTFWYCDDGIKPQTFQAVDNDHFENTTVEEPDLSNRSIDAFPISVSVVPQNIYYIFFRM